MKIHFISALGVLTFSAVIGIDSESMLWIFLAIALVLITEILNTFFEKLLDFMSPYHNDAIKHMKDMSAGSVLVAAMFAVVVAIAVFGKKFGYNLYWVSELVFFIYLVIVIVLFSVGGEKSEKNKSSNRR